MSYLPPAIQYCDKCRRYVCGFHCGLCDHYFCIFCIRNIAPLERGSQDVTCPFCGHTDRRYKMLTSFPRCTRCGRLGRFTHWAGCADRSRSCADCDEPSPHACRNRCPITTLCNKCVKKIRFRSATTLRVRIMFRECPYCHLVVSK